MAIHWRKSLAAGLGRVLKREVSALEAPGTLDQLSDAQLDALDPVLRNAYYLDEFGVPFRNLTPLSRTEANVQDRQAYLFAASCNASGFLRAQALLSFQHTPGRIAACAALIRCNDWAEPVRFRALELLRTVLAEDPTVIWRCLDLLLSLRGRQRMPERTWAQLVEPILASPGQAEQRWRAAQQGSFQARLFAFDLIVNHDHARTADACLQAISDPNPRIARWAIAQIAAVSAPEATLKALLRRGMMHPHASVRTACFREYARRELPDTSQFALDGLFETSAAYRNAAAYLLRTHFQSDPLKIWREAIDRGTTARSIMAVAALADHAQGVDYDRLLAHLKDRRARIRVLALRGLERTRHANLTIILPAVLKDPSPRVRRQALAMFTSNPNLLLAPALAEAYQCSTSATARGQLASATHALGKWKGIATLIEWLAEADQETEQHIVQEIHRWLQREIRSFSPLSAADRHRIEAAMNKAAQRGSFPAFARVSYALRVC